MSWFFRSLFLGKHHLLATRCSGTQSIASWPTTCGMASRLADLRFGPAAPSTSGSRLKRLFVATAVGAPERYRFCLVVSCFCYLDAMFWVNVNAKVHANCLLSLMIGPSRWLLCCTAPCFSWHTAQVPPLGTGFGPSWGNVKLIAHLFFGTYHIALW